MGRHFRAFFSFSFNLVILFRGLQIPFDSFVRTNLGEMSENQISMLKERVRSVGISILGGNGGVEGKYELGIDSIQLVNEEDIDSSWSKGIHKYFAWIGLTLQFNADERDSDKVKPPSSSE